MLKDRRLEIIDRICQLAALEDGWYFGRGKEMPSTVVSALIEAAGHACDFGFETIDVAPGIEGEGELLVTAGANEMELTISAGNMATLIVEREGQEPIIMNNVPIGVAFHEFRQHASDICSGYVFWTQSTSWKKLAGFPGRLLKTVLVTEASPLSRPNALGRWEEPIANIYTPTTLTKPESRQSSAHSTTPRLAGRFDSNQTCNLEIPVTTTCLA
jgi:hypothetical protein